MYSYGLGEMSGGSGETSSDQLQTHKIWSLAQYDRRTAKGQKERRKKERKKERKMKAGISILALARK